MYSLLVLLILVRATVSSENADKNVMYKWTHAEFEWKHQGHMEEAIHSGNYNQKKCLFYDANKADDGRIFITTSKEFGSHCPATLSTITNKMGISGGPLLRPYPDWSWHNNNGCKCSENTIVNVNRISIKCNHLFVLDTGKVGIKDQLCNPKLLIFDLKDDTLVRTVYIPIDIAGNKTGSVFLLTPTVYVPGECSRLLDEMIVFMADIQGFGLVVYNSFTKSICRVESDYMKPTRNNFLVGNRTVNYTAGIYSLTIYGKDLVFAPGTATEIYKMEINALLKCPNKTEANKQTELVIKLAVPTGQIAAAGHGILYCNPRVMNILGTNIWTKCKNNTVEIAQSSMFQPILGMVVSHYWNKLIVLADAYHRFCFDTVDLKNTMPTMSNLI